MEGRPPFPTGRGTHAGAALQFGDSRADLLQWALQTGDPLADAVAEEIHVRGRPARACLDAGIRSGLATVADPPAAIAEFLRHTETLPDFADDQLLDTGSLPFYSAPPPVHIISLSAGALIRVYESPSISEVLATTGRLIEGADRRIRETGKWVSTAMIPGGLRPGQPGYIATLQVRILHANMRRLARSRGFDEARHGVAINQVDLARTWLDFTYTSLRAEEIMGFSLTSRETRSIYSYWWLLAHLLGVDPRLVQGISNNEQAARVDALLQYATGALIDESVTLAAATLNSITDLLGAALHIPERLGSRGLASLARMFHGDVVADELQIPRSRAADTVIATATERVRSARRTLRAEPAQWESALQKNLATARMSLQERGSALYETSGS
ncbi:hypothetical protein BVC93_18695 [Mycobacterium sp. MS1601]|uniref:oxygenase MpaB family protein n=1 Tax=Mycobacterium sp. MS1601 TaxID=1936029 RepID=UPI0009791693|nr:oxygenase MpaB family protein [Mycobacterium sp. MS1601]AQA04122.1 hypothetical protein BVC93_18695 [Mycobacterium sp. MS1601]